MLIDFHTHIFPDKIAGRAIASLKEGMIAQHGTALPNYADGTLNGLIESMDSEGVDMSVIMPIATKPSQTPGINRFAAQSASEKVVAFGAVHPMQEDWEKTLDELRENGFKGIKLHPEFQGTFVDSPEVIRVVRKAAALGLVVTIHAGEDIGWPPPVHATPERIRRMLDAAPDVTLVAAHMGGMNEWDDVLKYLLDTNAYLDTAFVQTSMHISDFKNLVGAFGAERVLFASDSPWSRPVHDTLSFINSAGLPQDALELIKCGNAQRLLCIE